MVVRYCSRRGSVAVFDITQVAEKGSFAWKLYHVRAAYGISKLTYFVLSKFQMLMQEFLYFWIFKAVAVYCWHTVRGCYRYCKCLNIVFNNNNVLVLMKYDVWLIWLTQQMCEDNISNKYWSVVIISLTEVYDYYLVL
jgi:hypothetical protein